MPPELLLMAPPLMTKPLPATLPSAEALLMFNVPALRVTPPVKVLTPDKIQVPASFFTTATLPPAAPLPMIPVTAFKPVLVPLRVSVVMFGAVETPVTAPMLKRLVVEVAPAVKVAEPPSP